MNAFLKNEVRILLPTWLISLLLVASIWFAPKELNGDLTFAESLRLFPFFVCPLVLALTALRSFSEVNTATFSMLLAQPIPRARIWWTKILLLAGAVVTVWLAWCVSCAQFDPTMLGKKPSRDLWTATGMFALALFSGGLWTMLFFRQMAAAFWFTFLIPFTLAMLVGFSLRNYSEGARNVGMFWTFAVYGIAGILFARRLFLRAQDVQRTGGIIALPKFRCAAKLETASATGRNWRPCAALFFKELQIHQSQFVIAGVLILLHLAVLAARTFGGFNDSSVTGFILSGFFVLWFVMPMLIGCAAVSEERKLGTLESQLCLPVQRRMQFWIKFSSALLLSIVFGFFMPLLFEGKRIFWEIEIKAISELTQIYKNDAFVHNLIHVLRVIGELLPILIHLGIIAVILTVSFYASTLSRNTLQSLAPALLGIVLAFTVLIGADNVEKIVSYPLWRGWLIYIIGVPVVTLAIYALMEWNFKQVWINWRVGRRNATVLAAVVALVMVSTTAIYHRVWELLTPLEPAHGIARLEKSPTHKMESWGWRSTIQLADGRAWSAWPSFGLPDFPSVFLGDWNWEIKSSGFWNGTNWASVASSQYDDVGIKDDGSLWVSEEPRKPDEFRKGISPARPLVRVGSDQDWRGVAFQWRQAFLLKKDGTIWSWGENYKKGEKKWGGLRAFEPQGLETNSDWAEIGTLRHRIVLRKRDGEIWVFTPISSKETNSIKLDGEISIWRAAQWDGLRSVVDVADRFWSFGNLQVGTDKDRNLLITGGWERTSRASELVAKRIPLSKESGWLNVAGEGETVVALKADGSLWKWKFTDDPITNPESASAVRLGKHSDWIAVADQFGGVTSLAADGSLWFWRSDGSHSSIIPPLLAASRRPLKIGNIFDAPNVP